MHHLKPLKHNFHPFPPYASHKLFDVKRKTFHVQKFMIHKSIYSTPALIFVNRGVVDSEFWQRQKASKKNKQEWMQDVFRRSQSFDKTNRKTKK